MEGALAASGSFPFLFRGGQGPTGIDGLNCFQKLHIVVVGLSYRLYAKSFEVTLVSSSYACHFVLCEIICVQDSYA